MIDFYINQFVNDFTFIVLLVTLLGCCLLWATRKHVGG